MAHFWIGLLGLISGFIGSLALAESRVKLHFIHNNTSPQQDFVLSPMATLTPFGTQEIGARFSTELWNDGFISALNDSVSVEGSAFFGRWKSRDGSSSYFSGNMRWDFHLVPEWTVFAAPGFSLRKFGSGSASYVLPSTQVGGFWNFQENMALRADVELEHLTPRFGVAFRF